MSIIGICLVSFLSDWSSIAVMASFFIYLHRDNFKKQALDIVIWSAIYAAAADIHFPLHSNLVDVQRTARKLEGYEVVLLYILSGTSYHYWNYQDFAAR